MSLNPVQFGKDVIDQFGRYLLTTFPVADERLSAQIRARLRHTIGDESLLYRGPYVYLNRPFKPGPALDDLIRDRRLHPVMKGVFGYDALHWHQAAALDAVQAGQHVILSTGTGSGKTEAFMLPIVDHCLRLRDAKAPGGVVAVLVYPMNALVNDQLERLRLTLAGTGVTFGRYTGETPEEFDENLHRYSAPVTYTARQRDAYKSGEANFGAEALPFPYEEAVDKASIRNTRPRILLTNYAQLEYLLLRDKDLDLFRDAPLRFIVFDEVHTYTGALGSEVACLIRRLRDVANKSSGDVVMIGTSATISDRPEEGEDPIDAEAATRRFAHRLFGVPLDSIAVIREAYRDPEPIDTYLPPFPAHINNLLEHILSAARDLQMQTDIDAGDVPAQLVELTAALCGGSATDLRAADGMTQLGAMLRTNRCIERLSQIFVEPRTWDEALPRWRMLGGGRESAPNDALIAEMLAYLTLGALTLVAGDPLLRPKLHYFLQGLQGLGIVFSARGEARISFEDSANAMPLLLCRSCGQHYTRLIAGETEASNDSKYGYRLARIPTRFEEPDEQDGTRWLYLTDRFHTESDDPDDEADSGDWGKVFVCRVCHTIHDKQEPRCLNPQCKTQGPLVPLFAWNGTSTNGIPTRCKACAGPNTQKTPLISYTRSSEVADITILSQSMLTMMPEPSLRKVLIFADSRQEAAFQAGWMQQRARRFRLRHLAFQIAQEESAWGWYRLTDEIIARGQQAGILPRADFNDKDQQTEIRWFLVEEFAFSMQRRSNLEQLGLMGTVYGGLDASASFFTDWAERLDTTPEGVLAVVQTSLDTFRRRGMLSDPLLARWWSEQDVEVYKGFVSTPDFYRPTALVLERQSKQPSIKGWLASNGRSQAQLIAQKAFGKAGALRDAFLKTAWHWLIDESYLIPVELVQRRRGRIEPIPHLPERVYQVNVDRLGLCETQTRYVCSHCQRAQQVRLPSGLCPEYGCSGTLEAAGRDLEHYDVVQYTQHDFVPMVAREHTAQVSQKRRLEAERSFKSETGSINTIVATPTLEMGVDIGKLEMVLMRNVPPTPANYAQRAGRAGRRHRIAAVFGYAGGSQHDRYFFADPPGMIAGSVRIPAFSMQNEPLIRKHVHSATLTALRELTAADDRAVLTAAFPPYIRDYVAEWYKDGEKFRPKYFTEPPSFEKLAALIRKHRSAILARLSATFGSDWPHDDQFAVAPATLAQYLDEMPTRLARHVRLLFNQVKVYRGELARLREIEDRNDGLTKEELKLRQRFEQARNRYTEPNINNYALTWLAEDGFFPGYALSRESVQAACIQPLVDLSRPAATALRELTPANWVYADGRVFGVQRLNFGKLKADDPQFTSDSLREVMRYNPAQKRIYSATSAKTEGGESEGYPVTSYRLVDVEMEMLQNIDDRRELRRRVAFEMAGMLLNRHSGGEHGRVGDKVYQYLQRETVRLVNLGPVWVGPTGIQGFPICPVCGETRSPQATPVEIEHFRDAHRAKCEVQDVLFTALHVDIVSDVLRIGPYASPAEAVNAYEGLLVGARLLLDMGGSELEGMITSDELGGFWAVLYDPLPGGTGFLRQLLVYWDTICQRGITALSRCTCETACYQCLQHFRNQQHHPLLNRHEAVALLNDLKGQVQRQHTIAPVVIDPSPNVADKTESPAEERFLHLLQQHAFPMPSEAQLRVDLGNGNYTVADFAWPEKHILVFIDGTSLALHGNPETARRDRNKRRQAEMLGWHVVVITAQQLLDNEGLGNVLEGIQFFLEQP